LQGRRLYDNFLGGLPSPAGCSPYALRVVDDGNAIHYLAVPRGMPVYAADGTEVGKVHQVVDNYREHILDGIVLETPSGKRLFVDGPEVGRTAERGVTLVIGADEVSHLPPPDPGAGTFRPRVGGGRLSRLFGRPWKRD
jgi:sporulation protein YlmC with PRC-barrel domain